MVLKLIKIAFPASGGDREKKNAGSSTKTHKISKIKKPISGMHNVVYCRMCGGTDAR
jgi:hypothetical protein